MKRSFSFFVFLAALFTMFTVGAVARADAPAADANGYINTGSGIRTKSVAFITANVYSIRHDMKGPLPAHDKGAVRDADVDKKFSWQMLRDVDAEKIQNALREGFKLNGYSDAGKIAAFTGAFNAEIKKNQGVSISYSAASKKTTIWVQGQGSATVDGVDFMKAVWSLWFGRIDQPSLGDALVSRIP